jgi:hypothetical protein
MVKRPRGIGTVGLAIAMLLLPVSARADVTQTLSIAPTDTNWDTTTPSLQGVNPLAFRQFHGPASTLREVDTTVNYQTINSFQMTFVTPSTITV